MVHPKRKGFGNSGGFGSHASSYNRPTYAPTTHNQNPSGAVEIADRPILLTANTGFQVAAQAADKDDTPSQPKLPPGVEKPGPRPAVPIESPEYRVWYEKWYAYSQATGDMSYEEVQTADAGSQLAYNSADSQSTYANWSQETPQYQSNNTEANYSDNSEDKQQMQNTGFQSSTGYGSVQSADEQKSQNRANDGKKQQGGQFDDQSHNWRDAGGSHVPKQQAQLPDNQSAGHKQAQYPYKTRGNSWENNPQANLATQRSTHHVEGTSQQNFAPETSSATPSDYHASSQAGGHVKPEDARYSSRGDQLTVNAKFASREQQPSEVQNWTVEQEANAKHLGRLRDGTNLFDSNFGYSKRFAQGGHSEAPDMIGPGISHTNQELHESSNKMGCPNTSSQNFNHQSQKFAGGFSKNKCGEPTNTQYPAEQSYDQPMLNNSYHDNTRSAKGISAVTEFNAQNNNSGEASSFRYNSASREMDKSFMGGNMPRNTDVHPPVSGNTPINSGNHQRPNIHTSVASSTQPDHSMRGTGAEVSHRGPHVSMRANFVAASNQQEGHFSVHAPKRDDQMQPVNMRSPSDPIKTAPLDEGKQSNAMTDAFNSMKDSSVMTSFMGEGGTFDQAAMNRMIAAAMRNNPVVVQGLIGKMASGMMDPQELPNAVNQIMRAAVGNEPTNRGMGNNPKSSDVGMANPTMGNQMAGNFTMGNNMMGKEQSMDNQAFNSQMGGQSMFAKSSMVPNQPMEHNRPFGNPAVNNAMGHHGMATAIGLSHQSNAPPWNDEQNEDAWQLQGPPAKKMKADIPNPEMNVSHSLGSSGGAVQLTHQFPPANNAVPERCNLLFMDQFKKAKRAGLDVSHMLVCCEVCDDVWGERAHPVNDYVTHHITEKDHCKGLISWLDLHPNHRYKDLLSIPPHKLSCEGKKNAPLKDKLKSAYFCEVCEMPAGYTRKVFFQHLKLTSHVNKLMALVNAIKPATSVSRKPQELKDVEYLLVPQRLPKLTRDKNRLKTFSCQICSVAANDVGELTFDNWIGHMSTQFHMSILYDWMARCKAPAAVPYQKVMNFKGNMATEKKEPHYFCEICQKRIAHEDDQYQRHINSSKHKKNVKEMTDEMNQALSGGPVTRILEDEGDGLDDVYHDDIDQHWSHPYAQAHEAKKLDMEQTLAIEQQRLAIEEQLKQSQNMPAQQPQNMVLARQRMPLQKTQPNRTAQQMPQDASEMMRMPQQTMGMQSISLQNVGAQGISAQSRRQQGVNPQNMQGMPRQNMSMQEASSQNMAMQGISSHNMGMQGMPSQNMGMQGMPSQNMGMQGVPVKNMALQGTSSSGNMGMQATSSQNLGMQGVSPQNLGKQGRPSQNIGMQGMPSQNMGMQGMPSQNMGMQGSSPQNMAMKGTLSQNMGQQGMSPQKMGQQGMRLQNPGSQVMQNMPQQMPFQSSGSQAALGQQGAAPIVLSQPNTNQQGPFAQSIGQSGLQQNSISQQSQMQNAVQLSSQNNTLPSMSMMGNNPPLNTEQMSLKNMVQKSPEKALMTQDIGGNSDNPGQLQSQNMRPVLARNQLQGNFQNLQQMPGPNSPNIRMQKQNIRPQMNMGKVPPNNVRPQQGMGQAMLHNLRPQQNMGSVPRMGQMQSDRPQHNSGQVPLQDDKSQQHMEPTPLNEAKPPLNMGHAPPEMGSLPNLRQPPPNIRPQPNMGQMPPNIRPQQNMGQPPANIRPQQNMAQPPPNIRPQQAMGQQQPNMRPQRGLAQQPPNIRPQLNMGQPPPNVRLQQNMAQPPPNIRPQQMNLPRGGPPLQKNPHGSSAVRAPSNQRQEAFRNMNPQNVNPEHIAPQHMRPQVKPESNLMELIPESMVDQHNFERNENLPPDQQRWLKTQRGHPPEQAFGRTGAQKDEYTRHRHRLEAVNEWKQALDEFEEKVSKGLPKDRPLPYHHEQRHSQAGSEIQPIPSLMELELTPRRQAAVEPFSSNPTTHSRSSRDNRSSSSWNEQDAENKAHSSYLKKNVGGALSSSQIKRNILQEQRDLIEQTLKQGALQADPKFQQQQLKTNQGVDVEKELRSLENSGSERNQKGKVKGAAPSEALDDADKSTKISDVHDRSRLPSQEKLSTKDATTTDSVTKPDSSASASASRALLPTPEKTALLPTPSAGDSKLDARSKPVSSTNHSNSRSTPRNRKPDGYILFPERVKTLAALPGFPQEDAYCELCPDLPRFTDIVDWSKHVSTIPHMRALFRIASGRHGPLSHQLRERMTIPTRNLQNNYCICEVCEILNAENQMESHVTAKKHVTTLKNLAVKMRDLGGWMREYLANNKHEFWAKLTVGSASTGELSPSPLEGQLHVMRNASVRPARHDMATGSSTSNPFDFQDDQMSFLHSVLTGVVALTTFKNMKQAGGDIPPDLEAKINTEQRIIVEKMCSTTGHLIISIARRVMEKQRKDKIMEFYPEVKPQLVDIITGLQPEILKLMADTPILDHPPPS